MDVHNELTMMLVGDNFFVDYKDMDTIYENVMPTLRKADLIFANLEMPISNRGQPVVDKPLIEAVYRMPVSAIGTLKKTGVNAVSLATNHMMDFGSDALMQTIELLDKARIKHAGAGKNIDEARKPAMVKKDGCQVAFLSLSTLYLPSFSATKNRPGMTTFKVHTAYQPPPRVFEQPGSPPIVLTFPEPGDVELLKEDIRKARGQADIVVIAWHWGTSESLRKIVDYQKELGHISIDAGADLVIGHHPHILQGIEVYRGKIIAYSLGNFATYIPTKKFWPFFGKESIILKCRILNKKISQISFIPILINERWQPELVEGKKAKPVVDMMEQLCSELGTTLRAHGNEVEVVI